LLERVEVGQGAAEDGDDLVDLGAVEAKLGVAVAEGVDRLVLFQAVALEAEALGQLLDLADQDEVDVLLAEVALARRAVDGAVRVRRDLFKNELSLALRALENLGQQAFNLGAIVARFDRNSRVDTGVSRRVASAPPPTPGTLAGRSFNGRTAGSGPANRGSTPCLPAKLRSVQFHVGGLIASRFDLTPPIRWRRRTRHR